MRLRSLSTAVAALALVGLVTACGAIPGNSQVKAGITHAYVEVCESDGGQAYVCEAEIFDGKDKQSVSLNIANPSGWNVNYTASGVQAVDAIKVRGAVEQSISSDLKEATPGIVKAVTDAVVKVLSP